MFDKVTTNGSIKNLDFISYYSSDGYLVGVLASGVQNNRKLLLLREAFKLGYTIHASNITSDPDSFFTKLNLKLNQAKLAGCFFKNIFENRFNPFQRIIIFKDPTWYNELDLRRFKNSKKMQNKPKSPFNGLKEDILF